VAGDLNCLLLKEPLNLQLFIELNLLITSISDNGFLLNCHGLSWYLFDFPDPVSEGATEFAATEHVHERIVNAMEHKKMADVRIEFECCRTVCT